MSTQVVPATARVAGHRHSHSQQHKQGLLRPVAVQTSGRMSAHPRPTTKLPPAGTMSLQLTVLSSTRSVVPGSSVRYLDRRLSF